MSLNLIFKSLFIFVLIFSSTFITAAQITTASDRGYTPGGSYAISDIETISTQSGNMMLNIPLGSLLAGRGGMSASLSMNYNSKLWDRTVSEQDYPATGTVTGLDASIDGGWKYGYRYFIRMREGGTGYVPSLVMPDGSEHPLCIINGSGHPNCEFATFTTGTSVDYFTIDGTYLKLRVTGTTGYDVMNMTWTLSMPDGSEVINKPSGTSVDQRTIDRNNNQIDVTEYATDSGYSNHKTTHIEDQLGRKIVIEYEYDHSGHPDEDRILFEGFGGEDMFTRVKWKTVNVTKRYKACIGGCTPLELTYQNIYQDFREVEKIYLPEPISDPTKFGGLYYQFDYHTDTIPGSSPTATVGWGEVKQVTTPSGAYSTYEFSSDIHTNAINAYYVTNNRLTQKTLNYTETYDGSTVSKTDTWTYGAATPTSSTGAVSTITGPDGGVTTQTFDYIPGTITTGAKYTLATVNSDGSISESYYAVNNPIAPVSSPDAVSNPFVKYEYKTIADSSGSPSKTAIKEYSRDKNGNVTEVKEYDFVAYSSIPRDSNGYPTGLPSGISSSLKRITQTEYYNPVPDSASTTYNDADSYHLSSSSRLRSLPKATEVLNASSTPQSRSEITYDYTDYSGSNTKGGNPTATKVWDSTKGSYSNPLTSGNWITTSATYDSYGNPTVTTDARGVDTTITYGCIDGNVSCSGTLKDLYPTKVEKASNYSGVKLTSTSTYDFYTGLTTSSKDEDNGLKNATEYDYLGRPTKSISAATDTTWESWTTTTYYDANRYVVVKSDVAAKGDGKKVATQFYDQLGRVRLSKTLEDAATQSATNETEGIKVQTRYKTTYSSPNGYNYQVTSNPYRADYSYNESAATMGWTRSKSWHTGHHAETETFDGSTLPYPFLTSGYNTNSTGVVQTDTDSNATTVTDQAGKLRRSITNGIGQMTRVDEPNSSNVLGAVGSPNQYTEYTYDVFNNLLTVSQGSQTRTFTYSSLSRLLTAANPESGTIRYGYDPNGNLQTKWDARDIKTIYDYDELNRVKKRCYKVRTSTLGATTCASASSETAETNTPDVTYTYDAQTHAKGKLTKVSSSVSATEYTAFDILGRVTAHKQTTDSVNYTTAYTYNLAGGLIEETYPSGRVVKNTYASDASLSQVQTKPSGGSFADRATTFVYNAAGAAQSLKLGNNKYETTQFNARLQPIQIGLGTSATDYSLLKIEYGYGTTANNGNVLSQEITVPGLTPHFIQNYTYDSLNRLESATETYNSAHTWKQEFSYDRYGNRNFVTGSGHTTTLGSCTTMCNPTFDSATNRITSSGYTYDASGNTTVDPLSRTFVYDGENKQTSVSNTGGSIGTYSYDGDGKRIKKIDATGGTLFLYDAAGRLVEEVFNAAPICPEGEKECEIPGPVTTSYVYVGSRLLSTETPSGTTYLTADHLGSPRINTNGSGGVVGRHDYHPFGEEIYTSQRTTGVGYATDGVRKQFTGYERDAETGLDFAQARFSNSSIGRFSSPDDFVNDTFVSDPQTWNLYVYVRNNPLRYADPDGEERIKLGDSEEQVKKDLEEAKQKKKAIDKDKTITKEEKKKQLNDQKAKIGTLETKLEGTRVVGSILKALDKIGERNGLQLSDFELTTDGKKDFSNLSAENQKILLGADAFTNVPGENGMIFIRTDDPDGFYRMSQMFPDYIFYGASGLAHEQYHRDNPGEIHSKAFERQKVVLKKFQKSYQHGIIYDANLKFVEEGVNGKYN